MKNIFCYNELIFPVSYFFGISRMPCDIIFGLWAEEPFNLPLSQLQSHASTPWVKEHNCPGCLGVTAGVVVVKGAEAVMLFFRLDYKTSVVCHNVNSQNVKIVRGCQ